MPFLNPIYIIALLIAVSIHEWAHAMVATRLGDPTPGDAGRLSINPIAHLDLLGALLFLTVGFGWAKPVPINPLYFRHPKRDICLTAIAGPASNLILAFVSFMALVLLGQRAGFSPWALLQITGSGPVWQVFLVQLLGASLFLNLGLMAFNLLPIAPLDGSKVLQAFVPLRYAEQYEEFMRVGPYIVLALFLGEMLVGLPVLSFWITTIMEWVLRGMELFAATLGL
ncbi:MAG: site-2 protease family protein [Candidatus Peribacteraceae bacterium]|nr:site-2 protease family protein [Candidatus Peribacteraceae bacterium]